MKITLTLNVNSKQADDLVHELIASLSSDGYEILDYEVRQ